MFKELNPYQHLRHFTRLCKVHYARNIIDTGHTIPQEIKHMMLSLATSEPLPDFHGTVKTIEESCKKAKG